MAEAHLLEEFGTGGAGALLAKLRQHHWLADVRGGVHVAVDPPPRKAQLRRIVLALQHDRLTVSGFAFLASASADNSQNDHLSIAQIAPENVNLVGLFQQDVVLGLL